MQSPHSIKGLMKSVLGKVGQPLPSRWKRSLLRTHGVFRHLCLNDQEVIYDRYLGDLTFAANPQFGVDREVLSGAYEAELQGLIQRRVKAGQICLDVGANTGAIALALAKQVGPEGKVFAFEPGPFADNLERNLQLNPALRSRVEVLRRGLGAQPGTLYWERSGVDAGNASLKTAGERPVPVTTIDAFVAEQGISRVDFIKIDTEGMELPILQGAEKTLRTHAPEIVFETLLHFEDYVKAPIRKLTEQYLRGLGYALFAFDKKAVLTPVTYPHFGLNTLAKPETR